MMNLPARDFLAPKDFLAEAPRLFLAGVLSDTSLPTGVFAAPKLKFMFLVEVTEGLNADVTGFETSLGVLALAAAIAVKFRSMFLVDITVGLKALVLP